MEIAEPSSGDRPPSCSGRIGGADQLARNESSSSHMQRMNSFERQLDLIATNQIDNARVQRIVSTVLQKSPKAEKSSRQQAEGHASNTSEECLPDAIVRGKPIIMPVVCVCVVCEQVGMQMACQTTHFEKIVAEMNTKMKAQYDLTQKSLDEMCNDLHSLRCGSFEMSRTTEWLTQKLAANSVVLATRVVAHVELLQRDLEAACFARDKHDISLLRSRYKVDQHAHLCIL